MDLEKEEEQQLIICDMTAIMSEHYSIENIFDDYKSKARENGFNLLVTI